ncbi:hypothetical protein BRAS3843_250014 [Bradyrhizobium sp. STM 3843]|nr:hypothetical protein BRAS3843_250014 [Bradyrhizobium sp. STM 3843]
MAGQPVLGYAPWSMDEWSEGGLTEAGAPPNDDLTGTRVRSVGGVSRLLYAPSFRIVKNPPRRGGPGCRARRT